MLQRTNRCLHINRVIPYSKFNFYQNVPERREDSRNRPPHGEVEFELFPHEKLFLGRWLSGCDELGVYTYAQSLQLCPTRCNPVDCRPPGSSVLGILQATILEWVVIFSPGDLPDPGIEPASCALAGVFFTTEPLGKTSELSRHM